MMMGGTVESEEEALFRSYPYALYFVQSPLSSSYSPSQHHQAALAAPLSRYSSSSRGSNSFLKKYSSHSHYSTLNFTNNNNNNNAAQQDQDNQHHHPHDEADDDDDHDHAMINVNSTNNNGDHHHHHHHIHMSRRQGSDVQLMYEYFYNPDDGEVISDDDDHIHSKTGSSGGDWIQYFSFGYSNSAFWILVQLTWRFLLSFFVALMVFYAAVKPPPPAVSVQVARIGQFRLGEGVDGSGVTTKILSCNCTMDVIIDNKSKLFNLHIHPPFIEMAFGHLPLASFQGKEEVQAASNDKTTLELSVGTRNRAMYGGGREMQDMLESGKGLSLEMRVRLRSSFQVIWGVFHPKFHHEAQCLVVLADKYDKKHRTQVYNSTCVLSPNHS